MTAVDLPLPTRRGNRADDGYGYARMPHGFAAPEPQRIERMPYGRFRNVYLYISEACQLRCQHCYMGERLVQPLKMDLPEIVDTLSTWRKMGGSKLTILGGEPTLHPDFIAAVHVGKQLGYEQVITTTNGLKPALRKFRLMLPSDLNYVQVSLDGGSPDTHDLIRGAGTFDAALSTTAELATTGFDTRIICTVNKTNVDDALRLLDIADDLGVSLVKYHVFSTIGNGHGNAEMAMTPPEWVAFCDVLERRAPHYRARVWYQPTYAPVEKMTRYAAEGYQGCIGRTLDRISVFPDGRCYVCSYLFDTDLFFAQMQDGQVVLNHGDNEFDLFTKPLATSACGDCKAAACMGGCPAEEVVMGTSSCKEYEGIVPVCRLWKSSAKPEG
jgi:radical SAM protein with 4Fe4S-binding SPASM domain